MPANPIRCFEMITKCLPYLCGFAAAAALDSVIDIKTLFLPVMAGATIVSAAAVTWRPGR